MSTTTSLGYGVGLRSCHFRWLEQNLLPEQSGVDWFEAITENILDHHGYARHMLFKLREHYPIVLHGVSMSIGSTDPLNENYLNKLKTLADELQPEWISDHLCWTGIMNLNSHDLLPMPLTHESLEHICQRIHHVQEKLQRPLVLENPSSYLAFQDNELHEWEFLAEMVKRTDCKLLIDVNNIYVSGFNLGFAASTYLQGIPLDAIQQIHLAGPTHMGSHLIDTHDQPVPTEVWQIYYDLIQASGKHIATLLEWDANIPDFPELVSELKLAKQVLQGSRPIVTAAQKADNNQNHTTISTPISAQIDRVTPQFAQASNE